MITAAFTHRRINHEQLELAKLSKNSSSLQQLQFAKTRPVLNKQITALKM
jgi:hypothetical protein